MRRKDGITIRHSIGGRLRLRVPRLKGLKGDPGNVRAVSVALSALRGVRHAEVHPSSSSIIFVYDPGVTGKTDLLEFVTQKFGTPKRQAEFLRHLSPVPSRRGDAGEYVQTRPWQLLETTALTALLAYRG